MIKQIFFLKRKNGLTFEEFKKHYLEVHVELAKKHIPDIRKYIVNFPLQRGKENIYDAITETYWDDYETIVKWAKSDIYNTVIKEDEEKLFEEIQAVLTEEHIQK